MRIYCPLSLFCTSDLPVRANPLHPTAPLPHNRPLSLFFASDLPTSVSFVRSPFSVPVICLCVNNPLTFFCASDLPENVYLLSAHLFLCL